MAKLPIFQDTPLNPDIIKLLHDEVVSLCQKNYSYVSGLEIDGIICISLLDTNEQQVVKIHKTLKSVFPDSLIKKKTRQDDFSAPSIWLQSDAQKSGNASVGCDRSSENYSEDIDALSNLLRDTNAAINEEESHARFSAEDDVFFRKSKRKRKQPRQRNIKEMNELVYEDEEADKNEQGTDSKNETESSVGISCVDSLIQKDITVKKEKLDPEYEIAEQTQPKIVSVASMSCSSSPSVDTNSSLSMTRVASLIEKLIDKEIYQPVPKSETRTNFPLGITAHGEESMNFKETVGQTDARQSTGYKEIEIKVEKDGVSIEFDANEEKFENEINGAMDSGTGDNNSDSEGGRANWVYPDDSTHEKEDRLQGLSEDINGLRGQYSNETGQDQKDSSEKSWIEMVKDNVSRYQAALMRGTKTKRNIENPKSEASVPVVQTSTIAKKASGLVALLKKPPVALSKTHEISLSTQNEMFRHTRGSSVPSQCSNIGTERSSSLSPVVKIEIDEEATPDMHSQSDGEVSNQWDSQKQAACTSNERQEDPGVKLQQGKLESRYPALFSHLQAKKTNYGDQDQSDSLVNRLPFISFQELFSPLPRMNEATTMQLLAKARVNPYPAKEKRKVSTKKVWNWKKRLVRPKDASGKIISPIPMSTDTKESETTGVDMPLRKTSAKKLRKMDEDNDTEWTPYSAVVELDADSNEPVIVPEDLNDDPGSCPRRTRLSCGEKPRINFAEMDNSDMEMEEEDYNDDDIKLIKVDATESHPQSLILKELYKDGTYGQMTGTTANPGSLSRNNVAHDHYSTSSSSSNSQCKCTLCGLEFNQEYRWHYHMIKVHGVSTDEIKLFR